MRDDVNLGNSLTDKITIAGHITASGNISGSSTSNLTMGDSFILGDLANGAYVSASQGNLELSGSGVALLEVNGNISASGGFFVSSSGNTMINSDNTGSMTTHLGAFSVNYGNATQLTGSIAASGDGYGDIVKIGDTITVKSNMYFLDTDSTWTLTNATNDTAGADKLLAIALGINSNIDGMLLKGFVGLTPAGTPVVGAPLYMRGTAGSITYAVPGTSGNIVRIVGYSLTGGSEIYFNPDTTFVEVA